METVTSKYVLGNPGSNENLDDDSKYRIVTWKEKLTPRARKWHSHTFLGYFTDFQLEEALSRMQGVLFSDVEVVTLSDLQLREKITQEFKDDSTKAEAFIRQGRDWLIKRLNCDSTRQAPDSSVDYLIYHLLDPMLFPYERSIYGYFFDGYGEDGNHRYDSAIVSWQGEYMPFEDFLLNVYERYRQRYTNVDEMMDSEDDFELVDEELFKEEVEEELRDEIKWQKILNKPVTTPAVFLSDYMSYMLPYEKLPENYAQIVNDIFYDAIAAA